MPTPNKEHIRLLVDALRSKKYRQGRSRLARYDRPAKKVKYCCLGVACEVAMANGLDMQRTYDAAYNEYVYTVGTDQESVLLPPAVRDWFGFDASSPYLNTGDRYTHTESASGLNDTAKFSFLQLADAFERTYLTEAGTDDTSAE